jgi:hypothetical protein
MKEILLLTTVLSLFLAGPLHSFGDDILRNGNLQDGLSGWHGDGRLVYLLPDKTESDDASSGGIPVIKLRLSHDSSEVYQEYETHNSPTSLNISVDVMASSDFRRSDDKDLYTTTWSAGGTWYWTALAVPTVDFWIRGGPGTYYYKLANLKANAWTTVKGHFENLPATDDHVVTFCVPPGDGAVYLKNAVVTP